MEDKLTTENENKPIDLDAKTDFLGLTQRQINEWEARHKQFCQKYHRQPCKCSAWN
jgi:hypothetical protein